MHTIQSLKKTILYVIVLALLGAIDIDAQVSSTPPYQGDDVQSGDGAGLNRQGFIHRFNNWVYPENVLAEWFKERGGINPQELQGVLTNPYREDGTSLSYGKGIPANFTGHVPVYTYGNYWPYIGPQQTNPGTYKMIGTDTGIYYQNGKVVKTTEPVVRKGIDRVKVVNETGYSYLLSAGVFPGDEQPGMVMTIVPANGEAQLPIPPRDWWTISNLYTGEPMSAVPEVYASVAGLNPLDAHGWKHSSWSPTYPGGVQGKDFGTGGFAYTFGSLFGRNQGGYDLTNVLFAGFHTNEGYDPLVSGDPGYGCAFYISGEIQAVMDIKKTDNYTANAILVARTQHNPDRERSAFSSEYSHLKSIIGVQPGQKAEIHFISHSAAASFINTYSSNGGWKRVEKVYKSNTQANVQDIPLPKVVAGNGDGTGGGDNGGDNGGSTGGDNGGDNGGQATTCAEHGVSYINDHTIRIYHKKENWTNVANLYICLNDICYPAKEENGFYYADFNEQNTWGASKPVLGQHYTYQVKLSHSGGYYSTGDVDFTFTKEACSFVSGSTDGDTGGSTGGNNGGNTGGDNGGSTGNTGDVITGKFTTDNGTMLFVGQDTTSIGEYVRAIGQIPAGVSGYTSVNNLEGITSTASYGTGPHNLTALSQKYPESALLVAVYLVGQLDGINNGSYDSNIDRLIDELVKLNRPIYLRWGYEFDNGGNQYEPAAFVQAWKKMHNRIKAKGAQDKIAMVWHSACICGYTYGNHPISDWYPGDDYVEMMGVSVFTPYDCNWAAQNKVLDFARNRPEPKPVMICESTPQGYDLSDNTKAPAYGNNIGVKSSTDANTIWNDWYKGFFDYIQNNSDVIRAVAYINANWDEQGMWDYPYENYYWGDSRLYSNEHQNSIVRDKWMNKVNSGDFVLASSTLFDNIGFDGGNTGGSTGGDNGGSTGGDNGGNTGGNTSSLCAQHGVSYIDDHTIRVFHKDENWSSPSNVYVCLDGNCYAAKKANGYYYFDFNKQTTWGFIDPQLGHSYKYQFKLNHTGGYYSTGDVPFTFTKESCDFVNSKSAKANEINNGLVLKNENVELQISPNPVSSLLNIKCNKEYEIYNMLGQMMYNGTEKKIDLSGWNNGFYFIRCGKTTIRFIKN